MSLRRLNTIATSEVVPCLATLPKKSHHCSASLAAATSPFSTISSSSSSTDPNLSYTSLKEIISGSGAAAAMNSPTAASEISIRNHLVKQAAWAYLQPMSTSPDSATDHLYCRIAAGILRSPVFSLLCTAARVVADAFRICFL